MSNDDLEKPLPPMSKETKDFLDSSKKFADLVEAMSAHQEMGRAEDIDPAKIKPEELPEAIKRVDKKLEYWNKVRDDAKSAKEAIHRFPEIQLDVVSTDFDQRFAEAEKMIIGLEDKKVALEGRLGALPELPAEALIEEDEAPKKKGRGTA